MRTWQILALLVLGAVIGFTIFGLLTWRNTTVETVAREDAVLRLAETRALFGDETPLLDVDASGGLRRVRSEPATEGVPPELLVVLAYRSREQRLVRVDVPFWFVKLKGPAAQFALRDTGFDLGRLGMTASDLEKQGPSLVLDESRGNGDRILVWTE
jgi:hypothetical protein